MKTKAVVRPVTLRVWDLAAVLRLPTSSAYRLSHALGVVRIGLSGLRVPLAHLRDRLGPELADAVVAADDSPTRVALPEEFRKQLLAVLARQQVSESSGKPGRTDHKVASPDSAR